MKLEFINRMPKLREIAKRLPNCDEARKLFIEYTKTGYDKRREWLENNEKAAKWAIEQGFVEDIEPKHDWSGLEIRLDVNGTYCIYNKKSEKFLLEFKKDGTVKRTVIADGGAGNFDEVGRLIID